jgi:drug/metabolite transporter (DMT)-like permease
MLFQIALLAWLFLDGALSWPKIAGMFLAALGTYVVQIRR